MWGIWCFNTVGGQPDDWLRDEETNAILAFKSRQHACKEAKENWGFRTYSEAKNNGWCDVRRVDIPTTKKMFEKKLEQLRDDLFKFVKAEVVKTCDKNNWDCKSLFGIDIYDRKMKKYIENDESKKLVEFIIWADDMVHQPEFMYQNGVFLPY